MKYKIYNLIIELKNPNVKLKNYFDLNFKKTEGKPDLIIEFVPKIKLDYFRILPNLAIYNDKDFYIIERNSLIKFDLNHIIMDSVNTRFFINKLFHATIFFKLLEKNCLLLHACSYQKGNKCILLIGKAGSRRTSTMLKEYDKIISDDYTIIDKKVANRYENTIKIETYFNQKEHKDHFKYTTKEHKFKRMMNSILFKLRFLFKIWGLRYFMRVFSEKLTVCEIMPLANFNNIESAKITNVNFMENPSDKIQYIIEMQRAEFKSFFEYYHMYQLSLNKDIKIVENFENKTSQLLKVLLK